MLRDLVKAIPNSNVISIAISTFGLVFLYIGKEYINPMVKKRSPVPVPFELLLVVFGIVISTVFNVHEKYHISIVDTIPQGLPKPHLPDFTLLPTLATDCLSIAIICYMFTVSLGKLFARKHNYKIDPTQELYALGFMEIFSSFLPVYPTGAALSRSSVCESSGVHSQFYSVFTSSLLLIVILWLGPLLEPLPMVSFMKHSSTRFISSVISVHPLLHRHHQFEVTLFANKAITPALENIQIRFCKFFGKFFDAKVFWCGKLICRKTILLRQILYPKKL